MGCYFISLLPIQLSVWLCLFMYIFLPTYPPTYVPTYIQGLRRVAMGFRRLTIGGFKAEGKVPQCKAA